jgi:hypothetical protein
MNRTSRSQPIHAGQGPHRLGEIRLVPIQGGRLAGLSLVSLFALAGHAHAEVPLLEEKDGGWGVYTTGRVGGFVELLVGDGIPTGQAAHTIASAGLASQS